MAEPCNSTLFLAEHVQPDSQLSWGGILGNVLVWLGVVFWGRVLESWLGLVSFGDVLGFVLEGGLKRVMATCLLNGVLAWCLVMVSSGGVLGKECRSPRKFARRLCVEFSPTWVPQATPQCRLLGSSNLLWTSDNCNSVLLRHPASHD